MIVSRTTTIACTLVVTCVLFAAGNITRATTPDAPIDVGSRKQLFIDEKFIESSRGVELVMNPPYQTGEVLIQADQPWELKPYEGYVGGYCSVLKDGGRIRVWYDLIQMTGKKAWPNYERRVCYAESKDGVHFVKPKLGIHKVGGSTANNVVLPNLIDGCSVWIDPKAPPEHRYKTQAHAQPPAFLMHSSPDGLHWKQFARISPQGAVDTQTIIFWDKHLQRYVFYGRSVVPTSEIKILCTSIRRAEMTADLMQVKNTGLALWPDRIDLGTYDVPEGWKPATPMDYYGATVFPYEEADRVYIMLAQAYWHWIPLPNGSTSPATQDVRLAVSRDGKQFQRAGKRKPFLRNGPAGRFDSQWAWALPNPIRMGDEIWIYYAGSNVNHHDVVDPATPSGKPLRVISRAVMRLDGFVSADVAYEGGELTTPLIRFQGKTLELNLDTSAGGSVCVEMLDSNDKPIQGFTAQQATTLNGNSVRMPVVWGEHRDVSRLAGTPIKIRFIMRDCKLYAFQFHE